MRKTVIFSVLVFGFLFAWWLVKENPVRPPTGSVTKTVVVRPGDTLWGIVSREYPTEDPREMIYLVQQANDLRPGYIYPGQVIVLPGDRVSQADAD